MNLSDKVLVDGSVKATVIGVWSNGLVTVRYMVGTIPLYWTGSQSRVQKK